MTGKGIITKAPASRLRLILILQVIWVGLVCLLAAWWGHLALKQAARIAELEKQTGLSSSIAELQWLHTQRMLHWESATFVVFLIASVVFLFWIYQRDMRRAGGLQAFFASVTHELRTPLTSIRLQAESIADNLSAKEIDQRHLVERLMEDTLRLEAQVERTLELARVEGGGPVFTQTVNLRALVDRMAKSCKEAYRGRLEVQNQLEDLDVQVDPAAFQVILKNLLDNSIRHSKRENVLVSLKAEKHGDEVALLFHDNGECIEQRPGNIGKLFHKGPSSNGAGVGLYLVRVLMERMGGRAVFSGAEGFEVALHFKEGAQDV